MRYAAHKGAQSFIELKTAPTIIEWQLVAHQADLQHQNSLTAGSGRESNTASRFGEVVIQRCFPGCEEYIENAINGWCERSNGMHEISQWLSLCYLINRRIRLGCVGRSFTILGPQTMALVPAEARLDDIIYRLAGANVAHLLRKRGIEHILIGECYVEGIMDGESVGGVDISTMGRVINV